MRMFDTPSQRFNSAWLFLLLAATVCGSVRAQTAGDRAAYLSQIAELQRTGSDLARKEGKEALIQRYRALIDANPGYANNIQLETQIGLIYESDLSDRGEPPDMAAAYATYQGIIATYDPSSPYMKTVRRMSAQRAMDLDPGGAQEQYWSLLEDYPDDVPVVMESYFNLGHLAERNGNQEEARRFYEEVLNHAAVDDALSQAERITVEAYEANAALSLMAEAIRNEQTAEGKLTAIQTFLESHPDLAYSQGDLVERLLKSVEETGSEREGRNNVKQAVQALVALLGEKREEAAAMDPKIRSLRKQHRRQMAQAEDTPSDETLTAATRKSRQAESARGGVRVPLGASSKGPTPSPVSVSPETESGGLSGAWLLAVVVGGGVLVILVALWWRIR